MTHELNKARMERLSEYNGRIDVEDSGVSDISEIVIRIPMCHAHAEDIYHELGHLE